MQYRLTRFLATLLTCSILFAGRAGLAADEGEPASAQAGAPYFFYMISCGSYIEHRTSQKNPENQTADTFYVTGWLSAYNRFHTGDDDITTDTDIGSVMLWLEGYCRETPLGNVEAGLVKLTGELEAKNAAHPARDRVLPKAQPAPEPASGIPTLSTGLKPAPGN